MGFLQSLVLCTLSLASLSLSRPSNVLNDAPIIAMFAHPCDEGSEGGKCQYIAASYVKYIESAGGRVVPIPFNSTDKDYLNHIFKSVNGLFLPGGGADVPIAFKYLFQLAADANKNGDYFPVWGTCLGLEWIVQAENVALDSGFVSENVSLPLDFVMNRDQLSKTKMFNANYVWPKVLDILESQSVTMNNHENGISPLKFDRQMSEKYNVISVNHDYNDKHFVSTFESKTMPFYATQWHPEKNAFEWNKVGNRFYEAINHSADAVYIAQYTGSFFVNECRRSAHKFEDPKDEDSRLIYNYKSTKTPEDFSETYFFSFGQ